MKILIIEDDKYILNFINISLQNEKHETMSALSCAEGCMAAQSWRPDVILLDLGLPDADGINVIKAVRKENDTPIIVISARGLEKDKVAALDAGANDYVTKPFYMGELLARIRVAGRLADKIEKTADDVFRYGKLCVDIGRHRVFSDGKEVHLTPKEYTLLLLFIRNQGKVLTYQYILDKVWGYNGNLGDVRGVRVVTASLRRKLETEPADPQYILTEVGIGYRFSDAMI
jgi:two-component system KDP operon response regulator KdpE